MKNFLLPLLFLSFVFTSCEDDLEAESSSNAIAGNYILTSVMTDVAVDLDGNSGTLVTELLDDTFCLDNRSLSFLVDGTFSADVPDLDVDANDILLCSDNAYTGTYSLSSTDLLSVTVPVNGGSVTQTKQLLLTATTLSFTVTRAEIQQYLNPDPASQFDAVNSLQVTYTRQ